MAGYTINGYNYFKLRDIAALVDFGVEWDQTTSTIQIDTTHGYQGEGSETAPVPEQATVRYVPTVGDRITCQDGYIYEITDVTKFNNSMFAAEDTAKLPTATCDWSLLPDPELPAAEARHFTSGGREYLFMRNLYETRRMQYTLYNAIGSNPQTWQNGKPVTRADGKPLVQVHLSIPNEFTPTASGRGNRNKSQSCSIPARRVTTTSRPGICTVTALSDTRNTTSTSNSETPYTKSDVPAGTSLFPIHILPEGGDNTPSSAHFMEE